MAKRRSFRDLQQQPDRDAGRALAVAQQQAGSQEFQARAPGHWLGRDAPRQRDADAGGRRDRPPTERQQG